MTELEKVRKCCICIPLEAWGIKLWIGYMVLRMLVTGASIAGSPDYWGWLLPWVAGVWIMGFILCFGCLKPTALNKKIVFMAWIVLVVFIVHIWVLIIAVNGKWYDSTCKDVTVTVTQNDGSELSTTS